MGRAFVTGLDNSGTIIDVSIHLRSERGLRGRSRRGGAGRPRGHVRSDLAAGQSLVSAVLRSGIGVARRSSDARGQREGHRFEVRLVQEVVNQDL